MKTKRKSNLVSKISKFFTYTIKLRLFIFIFLITVITFWVFHNRVFDLDGFLEIFISVMVFIILYVIIILPKVLYNLDISDTVQIEKPDISIINDYRRTNAQIIGGILLLLTAFLTYTQINNEKEANEDSLKNEKEANIARITLDQYQMAINQLVSDNLINRLGSIYSLEKIMNENEYYHWKIVEILSAYVREKRDNRKYDVVFSKELDHRNIEMDEVTQSKTYEVIIGYKMGAKGNKIPIKKSYYRVPIEKDIQTILTVLGRKNRKLENDTVFKLNLEKIFNDWYNFTDRYFASDSSTKKMLDKLLSRNFYRIHLVNQNYRFNIDLSNCNLYKADLTNTKFDLSNFNNTHFINANLSDASFGLSKMVKCHFENSFFISTNFNFANLKEAYFENTVLLNVRFYFAKLSNTHFDNAILQYARFNDSDSLTFQQLMRVKFILDPTGIDSLYHVLSNTDYRLRDEKACQTYLNNNYYFRSYLE